MADHTIGSYIGLMSADEIWREAVGAIADVPQSGLLMVVLAAVLLSVFSGFLRRHMPRLGGLLRGMSTVVLCGVLVLVVLQLSRLDPRFDLALPQAGLPEQIVEGGETRVPLGRDGHYWLEAQVNGTPTRFMVDTGATLTTLGEQSAQAAGLEARSDRMPIRMQTANGSISASLTTIDELRFGNVAARGMDAVIAPNLGPTNVIGMNLLSRLKGWRVENGELILVPNNPQPELEAGG